MKPAISIIIPALDEEKNLRPTVETILGAVNDKFSDFEIIIFDDNSTDSTGMIADGLAKVNRNIKVVHNVKTMSCGYNFKKGVEIAEKDCITMFPGDDDVEGSSMRDMFNLIGCADCIISYPINIPCDRPLWRRVISKICNYAMNLIFGLDLQYYHGPTIYNRDIIKTIPITTHGFAYQAEALTKILRTGHSFVELGIRLKGRRYGKTNAFKIKNIISVARTVLRLFWRVYIKERGRYNKKGKRVEGIKT